MPERIAAVVPELRRLVSDRDLGCDLESVISIIGPVGVDNGAPDLDFLASGKTKPLAFEEPPGTEHGVEGFTAIALEEKVHGVSGVVAVPLSAPQTERLAESAIHRRDRVRIEPTAATPSRTTAPKWVAVFVAQLDGHTIGFKDGYY